MNYHEKSLWASLVSTTLVFGTYFFRAFRILMDPEIADQALIFQFILAVAVIVVLQIVIQTTLAIIDRKEAGAGHDERDKSIELRTTHTSYIILVVGIWISAAAMLVQNNTILLINLLMFFFVAAEITSYVRSLLLYRRGY